MDKKKKDVFNETPSSTQIMGVPITVEDQLNKYGTYEIQPTADHDYQYPKIAQGLPKKEYRKDPP